MFIDSEDATGTRAILKACDKEGFMDKTICAKLPGKTNLLAFRALQQTVSAKMQNIVHQPDHCLVGNSNLRSIQEEEQASSLPSPALFESRENLSPSTHFDDHPCDARPHARPPQIRRSPTPVMHSVPISWSQNRVGVQDEYTHGRRTALKQKAAIPFSVQPQFEHRSPRVRLSSTSMDCMNSRYVANEYQRVPYQQDGRHIALSRTVSSSNLDQGVPYAPPITVRGKSFEGNLRQSISGQGASAGVRRVFSSGRLVADDPYQLEGVPHGADREDIIKRATSMGNLCLNDSNWYERNNTASQVSLLNTQPRNGSYIGSRHLGHQPVIGYGTLTNPTDTLGKPGTIFEKLAAQDVEELEIERLATSFNSSGPHEYICYPKGGNGPPQRRHRKPRDTETGHYQIGKLHSDTVWVEHSSSGSRNPTPNTTPSSSIRKDSARDSCNALLMSAPGIHHSTRHAALAPALHRPGHSSDHSYGSGSYQVPPLDTTKRVQNPHGYQVARCPSMETMRPRGTHGLNGLYNQRSNSAAPSNKPPNTDVRPYTPSGYIASTESVDKYTRRCTEDQTVSRAGIIPSVRSSRSNLSSISHLSPRARGPAIEHVKPLVVHKAKGGRYAQSGSG